MRDVLKDVLLGPAETFRWMMAENAQYSALCRQSERDGLVFDKQVAVRQHLDAHAGGLDTDKKADAPEVKEAVDPDEAERDEPDTSRAAARDRAPAENLEIPALLLEHLEHEPQSRNRQMIVRYLGERFYGPARATLNHIADDPGETDAIREAARIALESIPDNTADEVE